MGYYYGHDLTKVLIEKTETHVEVITKNGKYTSDFVGENSPVQAIDFVNSVKSIVGKDRILYVSINTYLTEEEKVE